MSMDLNHFTAETILNNTIYIKKININIIYYNI